MIRYCLIILGCLLLGEFCVFLTEIPFPSSMLGMFFLVLFLQIGWVKLELVKSFSDLFLANLGIFFVPPSIKIMLYFDSLRENFWAILFSILISTYLVLYTTTISFEWLKKNKK